MEEQLTLLLKATALKRKKCRRTKKANATPPKTNAVAVKRVLSPTHQLRFYSRAEVK